MPPYKPLQTLRKDSLCAFGEVTYTSCKAIQVQHKCYCDLEMVHSEISQAVRKLQAYLLSTIPPPLWNDLFETVIQIQEKRRSVDDRIIFSTLIKDKMKVNKLKIGYKRVFSYPAVPWLLQQRHVLENLQEVDLADIDYPDMIPAICSHCINLEVITLPPTAEYGGVIESVIQSCPKLRRINANFEPSSIVRIQVFNNLHHLESVDWVVCVRDLTEHNRAQLKLRSLNLELVPFKRQSGLEVVKKMCPHLKELTITLNLQSRCTNVCNNVAFSALQLESFTLACFTLGRDFFDNFFTRKGCYLKELTIDNCTLYNRMEVLEKVTNGCPNLTKFGITSYHPDIVEFPIKDVAPDMLIHNTSFPNLEHLTVVDCDEYSHRGFVLAHHCISGAVHLKTLTLNLCIKKINEGWLEQLVNNEALKTLSTLHLRCTRMKLSAGLAQSLYETCKEMTYLEMDPVTDDARRYLRGVLIDAHYENLDFNAEF